MRSAFALVAGALTLASAVPAAAQEFKPVSLFAGQTKPAPKPPKVDWNVRPSPEQGQAARPSVVCGMTVIPADLKIDPKIALKPRDTRTKYTLKIVEPTVCKAP